MTIATYSGCVYTRNSCSGCSAGRRQSKVPTFQKRAVHRCVVTLCVSSEIFELHPEEGSNDSTATWDDESRQVCVETVKIIGEELMQSSHQPEKIDLIEIMQEIGQSMGFKVEYSRGQIVVSKVGFAHQLAQSSLKRRLNAEENWVTLNSLNVALPCGARRQPDISGWRKPVRLDSTASQVSQHPDWVLRDSVSENEEARAARW